MYSRDYDGDTLRFEASGGLVGSSLIMQDKETDTYWSIMEGKAVAGKLEGTTLEELPFGEKMQWRHWKRKHPDSVVLSVDGKENAPNGYVDYFRSPDGMFGNAADDRLPSKEPIFAFRHRDVPYAVTTERVEGGASFALESGEHVFLHRRKGASMFRSTDAYLSAAGFEKKDDVWVETKTGAVFDPDDGVFAEDAVQPLLGFDSFWYTWSLNNPDTQLLP